MSLASATFISYDVEPFLANIFSFAPTASSAYPPSRSGPPLPLNIYYAWLLPTSDGIMENAAIQSASQLASVAASEGQGIADAGLYGNYAIYSTPLERIYGNNLQLMRTLKQQYDPENVMGAAGGWKL